MGGEGVQASTSSEGVADSSGVWGQALNINGRSYDVGVVLQGTEKVLLLVEEFEEVEAPGVLRQRSEAIAGCPGTLDECAMGYMVLSSHPLESKGWYIFTPLPPRDGLEVIMEKVAGFLAHNFRNPGNFVAKLL